MSDDAAALLLPGSLQEAARVGQINILRVTWGCEGLGRPSVNCLVAKELIMAADVATCEHMEHTHLLNRIHYSVGSIKSR